jgi:hypothetical protein
MILNKVCDNCGEEKLTHHFCKGGKTVQIIPVKSKIEEKCQWFAVNQWLSDYPKEMTYEDIIDRLQLDTWSDPIMEDEDGSRIIEWYLIEGHSGNQIATFIEETYDRTMRLVAGLLTPEVQDEKA